MFVNMLYGPYYDRLMGNTTRNFADMVIFSEMIKNAIKNGKVEMSENYGQMKEVVPRKNEVESQVVFQENQQN